MEAETRRRRDSFFKGSYNIPADEVLQGKADVRDEVLQRKADLPKEEVIKWQGFAMKHLKITLKEFQIEGI